MLLFTNSERSISTTPAPASTTRKPQACSRGTSSNGPLPRRTHSPGWPAGPVSSDVASRRIRENSKVAEIAGRPPAVTSVATTVERLPARSSLVCNSIGPPSIGARSYSHASEVTSQSPSAVLAARAPDTRSTIGTSAPTPGGPSPRRSSSQSTVARPIIDSSVPPVPDSLAGPESAPTRATSMPRALSTWFGGGYLPATDQRPETGMAGTFNKSQSLGIVANLGKPRPAGQPLRPIPTRAHAREW